jgi:hypothetical protein
MADQAMPAPYVVRLGSHVGVNDQRSVTGDHTGVLRVGGCASGSWSGADAHG